MSPRHSFYQLQPLLCVGALTSDRLSVTNLLTCFSHLRSLDGPQSCDKCTKCLLYGDYRLKDTEMIEKLRQTLEKEEAKAQAYLEKRIQEMEGKDRATKLRASVRVNTTRN